LKLLINGEQRDISFETLGQWALSEFACPAEGLKGIALAVNNEVIPKSKWEQFSLQNGDSILAISATQGG
jgi:sulfur carrier protein